MQKWYFLSSQCVAKMFISLDLYVINYSHKKYMKEKTMQNLVFY